MHNSSKNCQFSKIALEFVNVNMSVVVKLSNFEMLAFESLKREGALFSKAIKE